MWYFAPKPGEFFRDNQDAMESGKRSGSKSITEAVQEGSLIDVTETAKGLNCRCRVFLSASLRDGALKGSDDELRKILDFLGQMYTFVFGYDRFGPADFGTYTCILEPFEDVGLAMVLVPLRAEDSLGIRRATGEYLEYAM